MSEQTSAIAESQRIVRRNIIAPLGPVGRYHMKSTLLLTSVPFICGLVLLLLLIVFIKLNLFYLEANGLIIDDQVREAYYSQVESGTMSVAGFLVLQLLVTAVVSIVVMRWASAPFLTAKRTIEMSMNQPEHLRPNNRWLSESPFFDRVVWLFALRVKNGGEHQAKETTGRVISNFFFLLKFWSSFAVLSVVTGYFMGMTISSVYEKVSGLAFNLVKSQNLPSAQHFFSAQLDILRDATTITTLLSLFIYFVIGINISRYMTTMIFVFARAIEENRFPIRLRNDDVYHGLASTLNAAHEKIKQR